MRLKDQMCIRDRMITALDATGIITDDELTPAQMRNLEDMLGTKVMDRTMAVSYTHLNLDSVPYTETDGYVKKTLKYMEKYEKYHEEL